jgi:multiple sugar transport system permease protein/putative aldouronate transport system permease protein
MIRPSNRIKDSLSEKAFYWMNGSFLLIVLLVVIYPLLYIVSSSFSSTRAVISGRVWLWPVEPSLAGYSAVFNNKDILTGYVNTFLYTTAGTALNVIMTVAAAYPLSRRDFKARHLIMLLFVFTMFFSGGLVPSYLLIRNLGLINKRAVMIIPVAMGVWNVIITRTFFESTIPAEMLEAAQIDGCSDIKFILRIVLPLSSAILAVISLFYAVGHWNAFFSALLYLSERKLWPLQVFLREILILNTIDITVLESASLKEIETREGLKELLKYSLIVVASVPVLCLYPFVQRYFVKGVMIGSIKG